MKLKLYILTGMNLISILKIGFLTVLLVSLTSCMEGRQDEPPNIIFILADDLGAGDLHCTGHPYAMTPHLDRLADRGIRFERAYMAGAWCAPSRYGLMSGQFPARYFDRTRNLRPEEPTITKILKDAGYTTAHIGKWHMTSNTEKDISPRDFGIDEHFLTNFFGGGDVYTWTREERNQEYWRAKTTDAYVDRTIDFIQQNKAGGLHKPFYVNLWIYPTHSYIHPTTEQMAVYEGLTVDYSDFSPHQQEFLKFVSRHGDIDQAMQAYCADVTAMDRALGRLFAFLESEGLNDNTLVVFSSDNGPGPLATQVNNESVVERYEEKPDLLNNVGSAKIYKERKVSLHDGGIRVPFIVSWPRKISGGKVDQVSVIHGTDYLPTIASLCGIDLPVGTYDGLDVSAAFLGENMVRDKELYWTQAGDVALLRDQWKAILKSDGELLLYDIGSDPEELNDLKSDHPDLAEELKKGITDWRVNMK
ncbi:MAG: sulfatase-like hydrolase/transferase [Bacteroidales bacterium]